MKGEVRLTRRGSAPGCSKRWNGHSAARQVQTVKQSLQGTMQVERRPKGRPRKNEDTIAFWQFGRAAQVMCVYEEARARGDKHSVAVAYAVDVLKRLNPEIHISGTEVKRILATWRPKDSHTILRFQRRILDEEGMEKHRWILQQIAMLPGNEGLKLPEPPKDDQRQDISVFTMRFAERPNYPRHNRKNPKE
jgi:hypothetical protein